MRYDRAAVSCRVKEGDNVAFLDAFSLCGLADYAARKTMETARKFPPEYCKRALALILETDYRMKTSFDTQERLLEMLILGLAQEARRD